jgi:alkylhydroperoxidase family enzyme
VTLGLLEKVTEAPDSITPHDFAALRRRTVSVSAIVNAIYICVGFNVINRIADALDFEVPPGKVFARGAGFMRVFGYKMMSGSWPSANGQEEILRATEDVSQPNGSSLIDPYQSMMRRLKDTVFSGPGTVDTSVRKAVGAGAHISGALGTYVRKVAQRDYVGIGSSIADLRVAGYSDDQIFEATVSAALGAGSRRLELALGALRSSLEPRHVFYGPL